MLVILLLLAVITYYLVIDKSKKPTPEETEPEKQLQTSKPFIASEVGLEFFSEVELEAELQTAKSSKKPWFLIVLQFESEI